MYILNTHTYVNMYTYIVQTQQSPIKYVKPIASEKWEWALKAIKAICVNSELGTAELILQEWEFRRACYAWKAIAHLATLSAPGSTRQILCAGRQLSKEGLALVTEYTRVQQGSQRK